MDFGKVLLVALGVLAFFIVVLVVWFIGTYNSLVNSEQGVNAAWSKVENQYQRRADLIPNLVNVTKGYAKHESSTLEEVTRARSQWGEAKTQDEKMKAGEEMGSALSRLLVVSEAYPDLKANSNFATLQAQVEGTENRVTTERGRYIDAAQEYNTKIKRIPTSFVADIYGYKAKPLFESDKGSDKAPPINMD